MSFSGQGSTLDYTIFAFCRVEKVRGGRMVSGRLLPGLNPDSPEVVAALDAWPGSVGAREGAHGWDLLLFEPRRRRERWWLHLVLFGVTLFSTVVAGSLLAGNPPIYFSPLPLFGGWWLPVPVAIDGAALLTGWPFGVALVGILAVHEGGHYFAARHHRISVTPPYFIPFPPYVSIIGTLGAFIRLRSPVTSRRALLDVGVAGPLMSFIASLPLFWWGLVESHLVAARDGRSSMFLIHFLGEAFWIGDSIAATLLAHLALDPGSGQAIVLHPVAFAGWLGLFVTALNLLPISQLDGGHILFAMLGRYHRPFALVFFLALLPLGFLWAGWWVWAVLVYAVGKGRVSHPPLFEGLAGLDRRRLALGGVAAAIFALCFVPIPFQL